MNIKIIPFTEENKEPIKTLNYEWLNKYFSVEPNDVIQLSNPEDEIVKKGGYIYYASVDNKVVGTVTLMKEDDKTFELGKMAVTEQFQGKGIGRNLLEFTIEKAKNLGAERLILYSNTKLESAIELYKKYGFEESLMDKSHYKRANIKMKLEIENYIK